MIFFNKTFFFALLVTSINVFAGHIGVPTFATIAPDSVTFINSSGNSGAVTSVQLEFYSGNNCQNALLSTYAITGGFPVQFPIGATIGISPNSIYSAADLAGVADKSNIRSITIDMQDVNGSQFLMSGGAVPCANVICTGSSCLSNTVINITNYTP